MKNKKLFTTLAALTVGSVISTGAIFAPAVSLANEHEKHDGDHDHDKDGDKEGDKGCSGEKDCSGKH